MKKEILIIGGDSKIATYLIKLLKKRKISHISTTRRKDQVAGKKLFLNLLNTKKFKVPKNIKTAIILAGIDGEKNCEKQIINAKKINNFSIPHLIKKLLKEKIFVIYISSMSIYNRNSLHGNLRLLAEQRILKNLNKNNKKLISIIRPTKNVTLNNSIIKWFKYKRQKGHYENFFQPVLFSSTANFIFKVAQNGPGKIFNLIGKKKIFFFKNKKEEFLNLKNYIIRKKLKYRNNYKITKPKFTKIIENRDIKKFIFKKLYD